MSLDNQKEFTEYFKGMAGANLAAVLEIEKSIVRHVPYISFATIIISLIFIEKINISRNDLMAWPALWTSWVLSMLAILVTIGSIYQSAIYKDTINESYIEYSLDGNAENLISRWSEASNSWKAYGLLLAAIFSLISGVISLLVFIGINIYP